MLKLDLLRLEHGPERIHETIPADHPMWDGTGLQLAEPVSLDLEATRAGESVLVRGTVRTAVALACSRCLAPARREVDDQVSLFFEPGLRDEDADGEVYPLPERGSELDLLGPIREEVLLRVPAYALCSEACRGLCPQCGGDRNQAACGCAPDVGRSPWDALKTIKFD